MAKHVRLPLTAEEARALAVGDEVLVTGRILTGRGAAHRWLAAHDDPRLQAAARGALLYHCAPVVERGPHGGEWRILAAGTCSSAPFEEHAADVIARYRLRGLVGKGGMGARTLAALAEHGAAYLHAVGSAAVVLARRVVRVRDVHRLEEWGAAEAVWELEVEDFPAVVTMDAHGRNLHETTADATGLARELTGG
jgi:fumarate hydratase class I